MNLSRFGNPRDAAAVACERPIEAAQTSLASSNKSFSYQHITGGKQQS